MNIQEIKEALNQGKKIQHKSFFNDEFVYLKDGKIIDEQGYEHKDFFKQRESNQYFLDGWLIFEQ